MLGLHEEGTGEGSAGPDLEDAGLARRAIARVIDIGVLQVSIALGLTAAVLLSMLLGGLLGLGVGAAVERLVHASDSWRSSPAEWAIGFLGLVVLHTVSEGLHGSTIGKRICGITVVSEDGAPAGLGAALRRSLGFLVDQFLCGLVGVHKILNSPWQQRVGDEWARTRVVRLRALPGASRRSAVRFLVAAALAVLAPAVIGFGGTLARVRHHAALAAQDAVEIVAVSGGRDLGAGREGTVAVQVRYTLRSASSGTLRLFVLRDAETIPQPRPRPVTRGSGSVPLVGAVRLGRGRPDLPDDALLVGLFPERNEEQPSAAHGLDLRLVDCGRPGAKEGAGDICVE
jgi:uncharacterized RDD family membrane protein YckC